MARYSRLTDNQILRGTFENDVVYGTGQSGIDAGMRAGRDRFEGIFVGSHLNAGEDNDRFAGTSERGLFERYRETPDLIGDTRYDLNVDSSSLSGGEGADVFRLFGNGNRVEGDSGKDIVSVYGSFNTVNGGTENDSVEAIVSRSTITGGSGEDQLVVSGSNNLIVGGSGNDLIALNRSIVTSSGDTIDGGAGDDRIFVSSAENVATDLVVSGGEGDDIAYISGLRDGRVYGGKGDDTLSIAIRFENSTVEANDGNDSLVVSDPNGSSILGGAGADRIRIIDQLGGAAGSLIDAGDGDDLISVSRVQSSFVAGGEGNDLLSLNGGSGNTLSGGNGDDGLNVYSGDNLIRGDAGNDLMQGGSGKDTIVGGLGADTLQGGSGNDLVVYESRDDSYRLAGESIDKVDSIASSSGNDIIDLTALGFSGIGVGESFGRGNTLRLTYTGDHTLIENLDGEKHFTLWVQGTADESDIRLGAMPGQDFTIANSFRNPPETVQGTEGYDTFTVVRSNAAIFGNGGNDSVTASGNSRLTVSGGAGGDLLDLRQITGNATQLLNGGEGKDRLFGANGGNQFTGGDGFDQMTGGAGADSFFYFATSNSHAANATHGEEIDRISNFTRGQDRVDLSFLDFTSLGDGTGSTLKVSYLGGDVTRVENLTGVHFAIDFVHAGPLALTNADFAF